MLPHRTLQSVNTVPALGHNLPDGPSSADLPRPRQCEPTDTVLFAGVAVTDPGTNTVIIDLRGCPDGPPVSREPRLVSFVATPVLSRGQPPILWWTPLPGPFVQVYSVDPGGAPINDVEFGWHCVVETVLEKKTT